MKRLSSKFAAPYKSLDLFSNSNTADIVNLFSDTDMAQTWQLAVQPDLRIFHPPPLPNFPNIPGLLPPGIPGLFPPRTPGVFPPGIPGIFPPGIPGLRPPVDPTEIAKCRSSLQSIPGCAQEIITTIFTSKFSLGPACCKAFVEVDEKCLLKLFPLFPSISALLKNNCAQVNAAPPNASGSN
nr:uncharacterized protein LOC103405419 [Malus domestica]